MSPLPGGPDTTGTQPEPVGTALQEPSRKRSVTRKPEPSPDRLVSAFSSPGNPGRLGCQLLLVCEAPAGVVVLLVGAEEALMGAGHFVVAVVGQGLGLLIAVEESAFSREQGVEAAGVGQAKRVGT